MVPNLKDLGENHSTSYYLLPEISVETGVAVEEVRIVFVVVVTLLVSGV